MSLFDLRPIDIETREVTVTSRSKPTVEPHAWQITLDSNLIANEGLGAPEQLTAYLKHVNNVPEEAEMSVDHDLIRRTSTIRFDWCEITYRENRPEPLTPFDDRNIVGERS